MPTDSIFHNVVINTEEGVEKLLEALEASEEDLKQNPSIQKDNKVDIDAIRVLMLRGLKKDKKS